MEAKNNITFIPETHTYLVDGVIVPSVTQIVKYLLGDKYGFVDKEILDKARDRGIEIHKDIELQKFETSEGAIWNTLRENEKLKVLNCELPIIVYVENRPFCCGTIDNVLENENFDIILSDTKTTSRADKKYLELQLNIYAIGYFQKMAKFVKGLKCFHLPKDTTKSKLIDIELKQGETYEKLKELQKEWDNGI